MFSRCLIHHPSLGISVKYLLSSQFRLFSSNKKAFRPPPTSSPTIPSKNQKPSSPKNEKDHSIAHPPKPSQGQEQLIAYLNSEMFHKDPHKNHYTSYIDYDEAKKIAERWMKTNYCMLKIGKNEQDSPLSIKSFDGMGFRVIIDCEYMDFDESIPKNDIKGIYQPFHLEITNEETNYIMTWYKDKKIDFSGNLGTVVPNEFFRVCVLEKGKISISHIGFYNEDLEECLFDVKRLDPQLIDHCMNYLADIGIYDDTKADPNHNIHFGKVMLSLWEIYYHRVYRRWQDSFANFFISENPQKQE